MYIRISYSINLECGIQQSCMYVCTFIKHFSSTTIYSFPQKSFVTLILMSFALGVPLAEECKIPQNLLVNKGMYMYTVQFSYNFTLLW